MLKSNKLKLATYLMTVSTCYPYYALAEEPQDYEFNTGFIVGSKDNLDLKRFNRASIEEGVYSIDVYTNDIWRGRYDLSVTKQANDQLGVCFTAKMLSDFGLNAAVLNPKLSQDPSFCGPLSQWNDSENIKDVFSPSTFRLSISVPQLYLLTQSAGYVAPEFWETGIPAFNLSYMANYYDNHYSGSNAEDTRSFYLNFNGGLSYGGWLLKHSGNMTWKNNDKSKWKSTETYLQRPIAAIKSNLVLGQFYTEGSLFDSIKLKGAKLTTDDNMYPDGAASYAPEVNGVAMSNALVTVRQNGNVIYQTTVTPGPFSIKDITSVGYGGDLDVTVKEADGSENHFIVPYASISQLLRPGFTHYQVALGKSDFDGLHNNPNIFQGSLQHGINNDFTFYSGITAFDDYRAFLVGTGINTGFGAVGLDVTYAKTDLGNKSRSGYNYRMTFNRQFSETNTNLIFSVSHSDSKNYYNATEALYFIDYYKRKITRDQSSRKNNLDLTINQGLPAGYGSFYLTGQVSSYWGTTKTTKQIQQTYNNSIGALSYSLAFSRVYSDSGADNRFSVNFNYPLGGFGRRATVTSSALFNNSHFGSAQLGVNGAFDESGLATYGINTSLRTGGEKSIALNTNYRAPYSTISANFSQGEHYRQFGASANGSLIAHSGGVTFTPNTSNTMVLIEAKNAKGAIIPGSLGSKIDSNGYAIASYVRPYRTNTITIDSKGADEDVTFDNTSVQVVPYDGSITKVTFDTKVEKLRVFNVINSEGAPLTFGQNVENEQGESIGVVGQGGQVFINDDKATVAIVKGLKNQCSFTLDDTNNNKDDKVCL